MPESPYTPLLAALGLSVDEAHVYELLLTLGVAPIAKILPKTDLKRGTLYNVLRRLKDRGLLDERSTGGKTVFEVLPPDRLAMLVDTQTTELAENKKRLEDLLPQLKSQYNLAFHKPNVRFFEGREGLMKYIDDLLTADGEVVAYIDMDAVGAHIAKENASYVRRRIARGTAKRIIAIDTPFVQKTVEKKELPLTEIRTIDRADCPAFATALEIYNNKVGYLTLTPDSMIAVIIEDAAIASMHRSLFDVAWKHAKRVARQPLTMRAPAPEGEPALLPQTPVSSPDLSPSGK